MGVFRQPPQPYLGGRQPLAPESLPPVITAVTVNDPPFSQYARRPGYTAVAVAWIPPPPLPFQGRRTTIVSVDNPPFGLRRPLYVDLSTLQPVQRRNGVPAGVQVDNPPPFRRQAIPGAGPPPQPTQGRKLAPALVAVQVDNPPVGTRGRPAHLFWLQWQTVPPPIQRRNWFVSESATAFHSPPAYVPGSSQLGQMYLGESVLGVANATPLVAVGSTFTVSGDFGAIQTSMGCTTGNEDVDIDSTFGPITTSFAITMQGASAQITGQFGPITTVFTADTAQHTAARITGIFPPITSAFRVTATQPTPTVVPGATFKSLLNFRPDRKSYKEEEEDEAPEQVEEPVEAAVPLTPEQQAAIDEQAQIAAAHEHLRQVEQAKAVLRAKHAAMLALLSQL